MLFAVAAEDDFFDASETVLLAEDVRAAGFVLFDVAADAVFEDEVLLFSEAAEDAEVLSFEDSAEVFSVFAELPCTSDEVSEFRASLSDEVSS